MLVLLSAIVLELGEIISRLCLSVSQIGRGIVALLPQRYYNDVLHWKSNSILLVKSYHTICECVCWN